MLLLDTTKDIFRGYKSLISSLFWNDLAPFHKPLSGQHKTKDRFGTRLQGNLLTKFCHTLVWVEILSPTRQVYFFCTEIWPHNTASTARCPSMGAGIRIWFSSSPTLWPCKPHCLRENLDLWGPSTRAATNQDLIVRTRSARSLKNVNTNNKKLFGIRIHLNYLYKLNNVERIAHLGVLKWFNFHMSFVWLIFWCFLNNHVHIRHVLLNLNRL